MEEMGRRVVCAPFLSSAVMATSALALAADEGAKDAMLPALASGRDFHWAGASCAETTDRDSGAVLRV